MDYDVLIIGAGMSGLAAGIRLAHFEKNVCILERHEAFGGLNSYYRLDGREFDVGLHAVTNYVPPGVRAGALPQVLRQLRLSRDEFDLHPQLGSEVRFPGCTLRFNNDIELLVSEIARAFPGEVDGFRQLTGEIMTFDFAHPPATPRMAREAIAARIREPLLREMLLCPLMFYGCAEEHDMDYQQFAIMFRGIYCEGFARPRAGVRTIIRALVKRFRSLGGRIRMRSGVRRLIADGDVVIAVELDSGERISANQVLSSAGRFETQRLCSDSPTAPERDEAGRISFIESISVTGVPPARFGLASSIVFFNDAPEFVYGPPVDLVDDRSGIICCPTNFEGHDDVEEGAVRLTALANHDAWSALPPDAYAQAKRTWHERTVAKALAHVPDFRPHVVYTDMFTPRTIRRYTGHINGAVYGAPRKVHDGLTHLRNLFLMGTDQGYLGIVGAMMSGVAMANRHVLTAE